MKAAPVGAAAPVMLALPRATALSYCALAWLPMAILSVLLASDWWPSAMLLSPAALANVPKAIASSPFA